MKNQTENGVWKIIGEKEFCCFKNITPLGNFCKNKFNLTGFCSKQSCPLSNSKYATVIEIQGSFFLYKKEERNVNFPNKLWKKIPLSRNFIKAIQEIDVNLAFWPKFFLFKIKQRLTKLAQILVRNRLKELKYLEYSFLKKFSKIYNNSKDFNVLNRSKVDQVIEKELLNRLNLGIYGNLYPSLPLIKWKNQIQFNLNYERNKKFSKKYIDQKINENGYD